MTADARAAALAALLITAGAALCAAGRQLQTKPQEG